MAENPPKDAAAAKDDTAANGARPRSRKSTGPTLPGLQARLEGIEPVVNNAFQASGAALLCAILALALGVFLLLRVRGLTAPPVVK